MIAESCPYSAMRVYVDHDLTDRLPDLGKIESRQDRLEAVRNGPFGVCVWQAGNNVVDHQVVSMEFTNGTTANCSLSGYAAFHGRRTTIQGTKAELIFSEADNSIMIKKFSKSDPEHINLPIIQAYHPEDQEIVDNWLSKIFDPSSKRMNVDASEAMRTLAIVFAGEQSRKTGGIVEMAEYY